MYILRPPPMSNVRAKSAFVVTDVKPVPVSLPTVVSDDPGGPVSHALPNASAATTRPAIHTPVGLEVVIRWEIARLMDMGVPFDATRRRLIVATPRSGVSPAAVIP